MPINKDSVCIIGVPIDLGAGRRGVDMGPSAIRIAGIEPRLEKLGFAIEDCGDLGVAIPEVQQVGHGNLRFKEPILTTCRQLMDAVRGGLERNRFPLVLGGDHSLAIGSVAGSSGYFAKKGQPLGLIWFDAHGDFNTPQTTPSGNIHGMSLAVSAGLGDDELVNLGGRTPKVDRAKTVIIGVRDIDEQEKANIKGAGVTVYTMRDLDERGLRRVFEEAIEIAGTGTAGVHLSFDLDVLDPQVAPGTGTPVRGGVSYREAHLAMEMLGDHANVVSMDMVEVNPVLDIQNQTALLGVELVLSLMGKRIL
ncbi:MAG: arginase [Candidatus Krumholzibacteriia bacterium]